jgi:hypothetical protein
MDLSRTTTWRAISAMLAIILVLGFAGTGCSKAIKVLAIAVDVLGPDPFFGGRLGRDESGVQPGPNGGVRGGEQAGLYGGSLKKRTCDKAKLIRFLSDPANAQKASAWARIRRIKAGSIPRYIKRLTPVLLRNDTRVRNHGFRDGAETVVEALLEAGIAVLIDDHGEPVVKCNCGNPLSASPPKDATHFKVDIPDKVWKRRYDKKKVTVVKPRRTKRIRRFYLADIVTGRGIGRPAGSDANRDVKLPVPPAPPLPLPEKPPAIVGTWRAPADALPPVEVSQTASGTFVGAFTLDNKGTGTCNIAAGREAWRLEGTGSHYTGTVLFLLGTNCAEKHLSTVWDVSDSDTLKICVEATEAQSCENWHRATK